MLQKIWAIARKELYLTYTDRNLLVILIATPLALATIIGIALGPFLNSSNDVPIRNIPIIIVNQDEGTDTTNFGDVYVSAMIPPDDSTDDEDDILPACDAESAAEDTDDRNLLLDLTDAIQMDDPAAARAAVNSGEYVAAIIIPPDFSANISYSQDHPEIEPAAIEVYANSGEPTLGMIVRAITEAITNQIATGNIALATVIDAVSAQAFTNPQLALALASDDTQSAFGDALACAYSPAHNPLSINQQTVTGEATTFNPFLYFGSSMAVFFMMFTAQAGANGILQERRQWTLQRLMVTPTPRMVVLLGKLVGTFVNCLVQMILLFLAFTLVSSLLTGKFEPIWGTSWLRIALVILAAVIAASGFGTLLNGAARSPEQGNLIGTTLVVLMGLFGGTFFPVGQIEALRPVTYLTLTHWSVDAFTKLALDQGDISLNLLVLFGQGIVMFAIGLWLFNRQQDV